MTSTTARRILYAAALGLVLAGAPAIYARTQPGGSSGAAGPMMGGCGGMTADDMTGGGIMSDRMDGGMMGSGMMGGGQASHGMMGSGTMGGGMMSGGDRPNQQWRH